MQTEKGTIFSFTDLGESYKFFANDPNDYIPSYWAQGMLYEREELSLLANILPSDLTILDIESNLGNHAIFFAKALKAKRVFCFEALPNCANILSINASLNNVSKKYSTFLTLRLASAISQA